MAEDLLKQNAEYASWEKHLCKSCKKKIINKMKPIQKMFNAGGLRRKVAMAKMSLMSATLWRVLCHVCVRKIKQQLGGKR